MTLSTILLAAALICFLLAAFEVSIKRVGLVPLGLALWVLATLLEGNAIKLG